MTDIDSDLLDDDLLDAARREFEQQPSPKAFIYACKLSEIPA